jgi:NAD(P)H dehydrogenase (quinone)
MSVINLPLTVVVVYYSRFGVVRSLAEAIGAGVREVPGTHVEFLEVDDRPLDERRPGESDGAPARRFSDTVDHLAGADAIVVGSPAYFGSMASAVKRLFEDCAVAGNPPVHDLSRPWYGQLFRDKVGAAFTASATPHGGNEMTLHSLLTLMMHLGMIVVTPGQQEPILERGAAPYGVTAIAGPDGNDPPDTEALAEARALGARVALLAAWLRDGRIRWESRRVVPA